MLGPQELLTGWDHTEAEEFWTKSTFPLFREGSYIVTLTFMKIVTLTFMKIISS